MNEILVLGGGFAGVESAIKLRKKGYNVTLVSNRDYLFVYPISIWIPTKKIKFDDAKIALADLQKKHKFNLIIDDVESIDANNKKVKLKTQELTYDYLVVALGMDKRHINGIDNTLSICGTPKQSLDIQEKLDELIKKGKGKISIGFGVNPNDPTGSVVRGGPAFELLFNISTLLKKKKIRDSFELNMFAPMPHPGKKMGEKAYKNMGKFFEIYKINKHVGKKIVGFTENEVLFEGDEKLESDLIIFISGGEGHHKLKDSGLPLNEAGFVLTQPTCQVKEFPEVYAIGDAAHLLGPQWVSKQGHMAEVMADVASYNIDQQIKGSNNFKDYIDRVSIVCVMDSGNGAAFTKRTAKKESFMMLPIIGHWLKKGWGFYYKNSKLKRIPRIPGM
jgi:sulfide:quinone oxidoreductase